MLLTSAVVSPAAAQPATAGPPIVTPAVRQDISPPLRDIPPQPPISTRGNFEVKLPLLPGQSATAQRDPVLQTTTVGTLAAVQTSSFEGVGESGTDSSIDVQYAPPDSTGEASRTQYVQWVNPIFAIFDKDTGKVLTSVAGGNTIWTTFGGPCEKRNDGDPVVQWDQLAERWVLTQFALEPGNYLQCVAVSTTSDARGTWHRYAFPYAEFPDYPKLSVWPDAYYVTFNMFGSRGTRFTGALVCAYDRTRMLAGEPATQICYQLSSYASLLAADLDGTTPPPAGTAAYVLNRSSSQLRLWRFVPNFVTPSASTFSASPALLTVEPFSTCSGDVVPQPATTTRLDGMCDRLMYRVAYRNLGTRQALLASHTVATGSVTGVRWYELDASGSTPTVRQQGTFAPADGLYRWMSSIAMDRVGNIGLGFSAGNASTPASIRVTGREASAYPSNPGMMDAEISLHSGLGSQVNGLTRWGDYSHLSVDPSDDCTFWFTTEYLQSTGSFNWRTRIGSFSFPSCTTAPPFTLGVTPAAQTVTVGQSTTFGVSITPINGYTGSGTFTIQGLPAGASATWSPTSTYTGGSGTSTLTVVTKAASAPETPATPTGTYPLTVTATDDVDVTRTQSATVSLTVTPLPDFSVSVSPTSRTVRRGKSTSVTVAVSAIGGFNQPVALSVNGLQSTGVTPSFSPTSITGSGSSTLTLRAGSGAIAGTYTLTIQGEGTLNSSSVTKTATMTLTVQ